MKEPFPPASVRVENEEDPLALNASLSLMGEAAHQERLLGPGQKDDGRDATINRLDCSDALLLLSKKCV